MTNKFYYLSNDTTFKYLFKNPKTRPFFERIIEFYTGVDVSSFTFLDNELNSGNTFVDYRLDSILTNKDKRVVIQLNCYKSNEDENICTSTYILKKYLCIQD